MEAVSSSASEATTPSTAPRMNEKRVRRYVRENTMLPATPAAPNSTNANVVRFSEKPATCCKNGSM